MKNSKGIFLLLVFLTFTSGCAYRNIDTNIDYTLDKMDRFCSGLNLVSVIASSNNLNENFQTALELLLEACSKINSAEVILNEIQDNILNKEEQITSE